MNLSIENIRAVVREELKMSIGISAALGAEVESLRAERDHHNNTATMLDGMLQAAYKELDKVTQERDRLAAGLEDIEAFHHNDDDIVQRIVRIARSALKEKPLSAYQMANAKTAKETTLLDALAGEVENK